MKQPQDLWGGHYLPPPPSDCDMYLKIVQKAVDLTTPAKNRRKWFSQ